MTWKRKKNGTRELWSDDGMLLAFVEPARIRGHWWWTTWGLGPKEVAGYAISIGTALDLLEEALSAITKGKRVPRR